MKIKEVFQKHAPSVKFDERLCRDIKRYANDFVNKTPDHVAFFGSGLLGVYYVRWIDSQEQNRWFSEICIADLNELRRDLFALPTVERSHRVRSDPFNLSIVYLANGIMNSKEIPKELKESTLIQLFCILHYKYISGLIAHRFPYGANIDIAKRLYEFINYKFDLKVYKTWGRLAYERSKSQTGGRSIHYTTLLTMRDDDAVQYVVQDVQTRIRATINRLTEIYHQLRDEDARISSTTSMFVTEEGVSLKDIERETSQIRRHLDEVIPDKSTFIRSQIFDAVSSVNNTANPKLVQESLEYLSSHYLGDKNKKIRVWVDDVFKFTVATLNSKGVMSNNLVEVMDVMKGVLTAARNKEPELLRIRSVGDDLVRKATGKAEQVPVSAERTSVVLYLILRSFAMSNFV